MIGSDRLTFSIQVRFTPADGQEMYERARDEHRSIANWIHDAAMTKLEKARRADGDESR
jgi:hypothetical protein